MVCIGQAKQLLSSHGMDHRDVKGHPSLHYEYRKIKLCLLLKPRSLATDHHGAAIGGLRKWSVWELRSTDSAIVNWYESESLCYGKCNMATSKKKSRSNCLINSRKHPTQ